MKLGTNDWNITDNAFDRCDVDEPVPGSAHSHNAYIATDGRLNQIDPTDPHDIVLTNFTYASGALGNFYHLSTNLINRGSDTATNAGLCHYTVTTNQVPETNSIVDIGFHFVALNASGVPMDSDTNNIADYTADREYRQNGGGGSGGPHVGKWSPDDAVHGTNLWLEITRIEPLTNSTTNVLLTLHNTQPNVSYQLQSKTSFGQSYWTSIETTNSASTNLTFTPVPTTNNPTMLFRAGIHVPDFTVNLSNYGKRHAEHLLDRATTAAAS